MPKKELSVLKNRFGEMLRFMKEVLRKNIFVMTESLDGE